MRSGIVTRLHKNFEDYVHVQDGVEFWFARDLQNLLGYSEWRNFLKVIEKARESCKTANHAILDHFVGVNKSIPVPKGGAREIEDIMLTRYACYLIAQSYFAVQTRKQEIIEEHIRLSGRLKARKATIRKFLRVRTNGSENVQHAIEPTHPQPPKPPFHPFSGSFFLYCFLVRDPGNTWYCG